MVHEGEGKDKVQKNIQEKEKKMLDLLLVFRGAFR